MSTICRPRAASGHSAIRACAAALLCVSLLVSGLPPRAQAQTSFDTMIQHDFEVSARQLNGTLAAISSTSSYPSTTKPDGSWNTTGASDWTSGFFPGSLWLLYERTHDAAWKTAAQQRQASIEGQKTSTSNHDVGFKIFTSFGNAYRLSGDDAARQETYRQIVLTGAGSLAKRYDPDVGCIRSWGSISDQTNFEVIIDNMMNLEILFWASKHGGQAAWYDMAVSHALKTMANHVRADGSTYHVVNYNPTTGAVKSKRSAQGYNTESTWSRGQAWAIYGFTMAYRETGDTRFRDTARRAAAYFVDNLPSDKVPYWDFELPSLSGQPRDSSAAAIAASGLFEMARLDPGGPRTPDYLNAAKAMLTSLSSQHYLAEGTSYKSILLHGTRNNNSSATDSHDTGLIYGDYYFVEALLRAQSGTPPAPDTQAPSKPAGLSAAALSASEIRLSWSASTDNVGVAGYRVYRDGGATPIASVTSTSYADTGRAPATTYSYTVAAFDAAGNQSALSDPAAAKTLDAPPPPSGQPIKAITFEGASLTDPTNGVDGISGTVARETANPLRGAVSARVPGNSSGYMTENFTGVDEVYVAFYFRMNARPGSDARIAFISNGGTTVGNLILRSTGALRMRVGSTTIGADTAPLTAGQVYRVGLRQKRGGGGNAVLEAYLAQGSAAFGTPFASTSSGAWTTQADRLRFGATNSQTIDATFDDVLLDKAAMPT